MKKLFSYLSNDNSTQSGAAAGSEGFTTPPSKISLLKSRLGRGTPKSANSAQSDGVPNLIIAASSTLNDAIQLIISDTTNLSGDNFAGYQNLVDILDDQIIFDDPLDIRSSSGAGCMNVLVQSIDHPKFIELCNQVNLASGLFQTMRLLRMMEIKHTKSGADNSYKEQENGITFTASRNVSKVMEKLCSHPTTIEQIRQLLVKVLTFPLSVLPSKGLHIQVHSAQIVSAICKSGFTSQQVWFLHDVQAISHMVRHLQELIALPSDQSNRDKAESNDYLLKGLSAEKEEMWIIAVDCIVEVINAASATSTVLLNDFETCGGSRIFLQILKTCANDRFLRTLNSITNLLSNCNRKSEDQMVVAMVASIVSEFLLTTLGVSKPVQQEDTVDSLVDICSAIIDNCDGVFVKDHVIQGISYALLTMYSNDPTICSQLEDAYFFLPMLVLSISSLPQPEPISAVLTTANYICQCTDSASGMIHRALCAAASVSIDRALDMHLAQRPRQFAALQNELLFSSIEAISRTNPNNATSFLKCGLLKYVVSEPLEKLCGEISNGIRVDAISSAAFQRIISLIVDLNSKSPHTAEEIRKSGIGVLLRNIVGSPCVSSPFVTTLLKLYEELSTVDASFLQESLITIMTLTKEIKGDWEKQIILFESLWRILLESEGSATMHVKEGGIECSFQALNYLKGVFLEDKDLHLEVQCLEAIIRFLSLLIFLASEDAIDGQFSFNIAKLIVETKIFQSSYNDEGIEILFRFVTVYSQDPDFIYSNSLDVISELFKLVRPEIVKAFINRFIKFATNGPVDRRKVLGDAEIIPKFLRVFNCSQILENDSSVQIMKQLVTILAESYLTLESSLSIMKFLLRPAIKSNFDNRSNVQNRSAALAIIESSKLFNSHSHDSLIYPPFSDFPYFAIKVGGNTEESTLSGSLAMFFTGETTISLPSPALTFSCWFRLSEERRDDNVVIIPLVSLESASNACSITLELNIDSNEVIVTSAKLGNVVEEPLRMKSGLNLKTTDWTYLVFSVKKIKRITGSSQAAISVGFNGIPWVPNNANGNIIITTDALSGSQDGEIRLGYSKFINSSFAATISPMTLHIGLIAIYPEILSQKQITLLFFKGPTYLGSDMNASATLDSLATMSTHGLRVSNYVSKHAINYLDKAGMKGVEFMVEPRIETHHDLVLGYEAPFMVQPIVLISAAMAYRERLSFNIVKTQLENGEFKFYTKVRPTRHSMVNLVDFDMERVVATLASTGGVTRAMSFSNCIAAVGGPDLLLPLLYSAQDAESLLAALKMLLLVTRQNSQNLNQVQSLSYRAIAYVLHQLPAEFITHDVFVLLLQFMNDNSAGSLRVGIDSIMLVDVSAAMHLLFNDHVWRSSNFALVLEFLRNIKSLVLDEKYSYVNCMRLSCISGSRWILLLCLHVIEKLTDFGLDKTTSQQLWKYVPRSAFEVADFRDEPEEFLQLSMLAVQSIAGTELRIRDLDLITSMILYTFQKSAEWSGTQQQQYNPAKAQTKWVGKESMQAYPYCTFEYDEARDREVPTRVLGPLELFRIYLLRLLMAMFDDYSDETRRQSRRSSTKSNNTPSNNTQDSTDPLTVFRSKCSPVWFLTILERSDDVATKSQALRLLGMLLQKDDNFIREFCDLRGFQILYSMLASNPQEIPVIIPIIAMLFRIPVQLVLHPSQLKSLSTFSQLLDLGDFRKELLMDPVLLEQTLPVLNIYHECMVNAERSDLAVYPWAPRVSQLMVTVLEYAFDHLPVFRQLMQNKIAAEIHISSFLSCTNAFVDFGSKIFESALNLDLTSSIRDNYIRLSGGISMFSDDRDRSREIVDNQYIDTDSANIRLSLEITHSLGLRLRKMIISMQQSGLKEQDNSKLLSNLLMSFSCNLFSDSYECDYQLVILQLFKEAVADLLTTSVDVKLFAAIGRNVANMVPLVKALYLYDTACFELLRMVMEVLRRCTMVLQPRLSTGNNNATSDQFELTVIRDLGYSIRFFTFIALNASSYSSGKTCQLGRLPILTVVRENMDLFFNNYLEDSSEFLNTSAIRFIAPRGSSVDDNKSLQPIQMFEALQGFASPTGGSQRKSSSFLQANVTQIRSERNKAAQAFAFFLLSYAYSLVLEDEALVRIEATRIIAYVANCRRALVEPVLSSSFNQNKSGRKLTSDENENQGVDIYRDGFMKLVPNDQGHYQLFLCGGTDDNNSEDNRFADFSFWISNNSGRCDKVFRTIDASLHSITPNITQEIEDFNRLNSTQLRARDMWTHDQADSVRASMERAEQGQRLGEKVSRLLLQWKNDGIRDLTVGAIHWRKSWTLLRSSPIWGYQIAQDDLQSNRSKIIWRVEYREGPEKARKKLLQDLSPFNPTLFGESKLPSPNSSMSNRVDSSSSAAATASFESIRATASDHEIEQLLRQMNKQGIFRKTSQLDALDNLDGQDMVDELSAVLSKNEVVVDADLLDESMLESASMTPGPDCTSDSKRQAALSIDFSNENDEDFDKLNATAESLDLDLLEVPERQMIITSKDQDKLDQSLTSSAREKSKLSRSLILKEIIRGIINNTTELKMSRIFNVERISGLESQNAVLFLSDHSIYILCGITAMDQSKKMADQIFNWVSNSTTKQSSHSSTRNPKEVAPNLMEDIQSEEEWIKCVWKDLIESETAFFHIPIEEIYSFFKRRHQLKHTAMEITDTKGYSVLFSCSSVSDCSDILTTLLERDLPASIFNKMIGLKNLQLLRGATNMYNRLIIFFLSSLTLLWQHGEITNFEYLMHINSAAGRSFHDLTQYPVFPWVIADYKSQDLDLNDKSIYRDLSKPMGALGSKRSQQYYERYQTMDDFYKEGVEGSSPPFFYGTHYSCAGYVLHYLLRLQPYANMSLALQGGNFDKADRLFYNIENSWLSASQENLQDVRELIPEFYYLPDFLNNVNTLNLGITQREEVIGDVVLPAWANNDPKEFVRIHRQALESKYVSENLNQWIDLIFGYKQRGKASIDAMNVFLHITYEGEVDLDAIDDPVLKSATLSQINNFGQTPTKLFHKAHPKKFVPEVVKKMNDLILVEPVALSWHAHLSPPLSVAGAPRFNFLNRISCAPAIYHGSLSKSISAVGDLRLLSRDRIIACPAGCMLVPPSFKRVVKFRALADGLVFQSIHSFVGTRALESEKETVLHEQLHTKRITCVAICKYGEYITTGSEDTSVKVWQLGRSLNNAPKKLKLISCFAGHEDAITCVEISAEFNIVVSGGRDRQVCIWDYRANCMIRMLNLHTGPLVSLSINAITGNIVTMTKEQLRIYHLNGDLMSYQNFVDPVQDLSIPPGRVVLAPPVGEWQDAVVAVTGHKEGQLFLWKLDNRVSASIVKKEFQQHMDPSIHPLTNSFRKLTITCTPTKTHVVDITSIKLCPSMGANTKTKELIHKAYEESRNLDLIIGDADGNISRWTPMKLDQLTQADLQSIMGQN